MSNGRDATGLNELEIALGTLTPRQPMLDRDALMYLAGRATSRRWQFASVLSTIAAAVLAITLLIRPQGERIVFVPAPPSPAPEAGIPAPATPESAPASDGSGLAFYLHLQEEVLNRGLDGLPPLPNGPDPFGPVTTEELLHDL
jgi:hypothetical protein